MSWEEEQAERERRYQEKQALEAQIKKDNEEYLRKFEGVMRKKNMAESSINRHMLNTRFYLMDYLPREDNHTMLDGAGHAVYFLKFWYPEHGANKKDLTQMKQSLKRFYRCMCDLFYISDEAYDSMIAEFEHELDF